MTHSRAIREMTSAGLARVHTEGRSRWLAMEGTPQAIWERAQSVLRTPVRSTVWVAEHAPLPNYPRRLTGISALAYHTMIAEPQWPVYAITEAGWKAATVDGVRELSEPAEGAQEWQVWNYTPELVPGEPAVDALSLSLSLQGSADNRIQIALGELQGTFPW